MNNAKSLLHPNKLIFLLTDQSYKQQIKKSKKKYLPLLPESIDIIVWPDNHLTTKSGNNFLIIDYKIPNSNDHIMAFSCDKYINTFRLSNFWIIDGTFSTSPSLFKQVYSIHGKDRTYIVVFYLYFIFC